MESPDAINIDWNAKDNNGMTGFHHACIGGHSKTVDVFMKNSTRLKIDLDARNKYDLTGFQLACRIKRRRSDIVDLIKSKKPRLANFNQ